MHIVMQCPACETIRYDVFGAVKQLPNDIGYEIIAEHSEFMYVLLVKGGIRFNIEQTIPVKILSARHIITSKECL